MTSRSTLDLHTLDSAICACSVEGVGEKHIMERGSCSDLRAPELEKRAAEELLRSDLDVKGVKGQALEPIEELEARERDRGELLAELVPVMEARGYYTGTVKAGLGFNS